MDGRNNGNGMPAFTGKEAPLTQCGEILQGMNVGVVILDREWRYAFVNDKALKLLRKSRAEMLGRVIWDVYPDIIGTDFDRQYHKVMQEKVPVSFELYHHSLDMWDDVYAYPLQDGIAIQFADISARKRAEEALKESVGRLELFFEHVPAAIAMFDREMRYLYASKRWLIDYGLAEQDITGRSHYEVFPEISERWKEIHRRSLAGAIEHCDEDPFPRADGRTDWVRWETVPWRESSGAIGGIIMFTEVITARKQAEEALKASDRKLRQREERLNRSLNATVSTIEQIIKAKDPYTAGHERRTSRLAVDIAKEMHLSESRIAGIKVASILHDVGKMFVPSEILSKPGNLSNLEYNIVKYHPQAGSEMLKYIDFPWPVAEIVLQHQERYDGSGYPYGLKGKDILIEARIIAVADVIESMTTARPYRPALGVDQALREIRKNRGIRYDPEVADHALRLVKTKDYLPAEAVR